MRKYFSKTLKPTMAAVTQIDSDKSDNAFSAQDVVWACFSFDMPKGASRLVSCALIVRGLHESPQTDRDLQLIFAKDKAFDGTAPGSLGTGNASANGVGYFNELLGHITVDITEFAIGLDYMSMATGGMGGEDAIKTGGRNLVLQGEPNSGTNVGYDKLYCGGIGGASNTFDFATGVILNDADDVAEGDTALVTDGVDADKVFAPGDVILKHDSDTVVGTIKSVSANLITLESGSGVAISNNDELMNARPVTVILGFEQ